MLDAWILTTDLELAGEAASALSQLGLTPRRAVANGGRPRAEDEEVIRIGSLEVNLATYRVAIGEHAVDFALMTFLKRVGEPPLSARPLGLAFGRFCVYSTQDLPNHGAKRDRASAERAA